MPHPDRLAARIDGSIFKQLEWQFYASLYLFVRGVRNGDSATCRDFRQTARYVETTSGQVLAVDGRIADMNADPQFGPPVPSQTGVPFRYGFVRVLCRAQCDGSERELGQDSAARRLDVPSVMRGDRGADQFPA